MTQQQNERTKNLFAVALGSLCALAVAYIANQQTSPKTIKGTEQNAKTYNQTINGTEQNAITQNQTIKGTENHSVIIHENKEGFKEALRIADQYFQQTIQHNQEIRKMQEEIAQHSLQQALQQQQTKEYYQEAIRQMQKENEEKIQQIQQQESNKQRMLREELEKKQPAPHLEILLSSVKISNRGDESFVFEGLDIKKPQDNIWVDFRDASITMPQDCILTRTDFNKTLIGPNSKIKMGSFSPGTMKCQRPFNEFDYRLRYSHKEQKRNKVWTCDDRKRTKTE